MTHSEVSILLISEIGTADVRDSRSSNEGLFHLTARGFAFLKVLMGLFLLLFLFFVFLLLGFWGMAFGARAA